MLHLRVRVSFGVYNYYVRYRATNGGINKEVAIITSRINYSIVIYRLCHALNHLCCLKTFTLGSCFIHLPMCGSTHHVSLIPVVCITCSKSCCPVVLGCILNSSSVSSVCTLTLMPCLTEGAMPVASVVQSWPHNSFADTDKLFRSAQR